MKYLLATFSIKGSEELMQICRDLLADAAGEAGFESFEDTEVGINGYVQEKLFHEDVLKKSIKCFPLESISISYTLSNVEDHDWNSSWENMGFEPIKIDNKIIIYDARNNYAHTKSLIEIGIEAKSAFGTGTHSTTQMIISTMLHLNIKGKNVLDCGCGTGILGIAALKLGAADVTGYDIDEWSVQNSTHNAELNGVSFKDVHLGDSSVIKTFTERYDIVVANINRNILLNDMPEFVSVMKSDAILILSGFYEEDVPMLIEKASSLGLRKREQKVNERWCCLSFKRAIRL